MWQRFAHLIDLEGLIYVQLHLAIPALKPCKSVLKDGQVHEASIMTSPTCLFTPTVRKRVLKDEEASRPMQQSSCQHRIGGFSSNHIENAMFNHRY